MHKVCGYCLAPIDDQVHFREPGLTHKGEIATESAAAAAGGITSFMEMPNTVPQALTQGLLQDQIRPSGRGERCQLLLFHGGHQMTTSARCSKPIPKKICGVKVFMGSSTGNMLVDNRSVLEAVFKESPTLVATHCEDEATIRRNTAAARDRFGEVVPIGQHPLIRSAEACYRSSSMAVELAEKSNNSTPHPPHLDSSRGWVVSERHPID